MQNVIWTFAMFWFLFYNSFDATYLYEYTFILGYNLFFTSLPVIVLGGGCSSSLIVFVTDAWGSFRPRYQCEGVLGFSSAVHSWYSGPRVHPDQVLAIYVRRLLSICYSLFHCLFVFLWRRTIFLVWQDSGFPCGLWNNGRNVCNLLGQFVRWS